MSAPFRTQRRVEFCETDAAGIVHFSSFFTYMEQAEHELLRHCGTSVITYAAEEKHSWPRVAAKCEFRNPVMFEDLLDIATSITRLGRSSVTYAFHFTHTGRDVAEGEITAVYCRFSLGQAPASLPIPAELVEKLAPFVQARTAS